MSEDAHLVDVTPGAHCFLDALSTCSFKLACGCTVRPDAHEPDEAHLWKGVGCETTCFKHGEQVITRATQRLVGWKEPTPEQKWFRASSFLGFGAPAPQSKKEGS